MKRLGQLLIVLFLLTHIPSSAKAELIRFDFDGTFEVSFFAGPVVPNGSAFSGFFQFDNQLMGTDHVISGGGLRTTYLPVEIQLTVASQTISTSDGQLIIQNASTFFNDNILLQSSALSGTLNGHNIKYMQLYLDGWLTTFDSTALPTDINMSDYQGGDITILSDIVGGTLSNQSRNSDTWGLGEFNVQKHVSVPEPSTMFLLGSGLAGIVVLRRKFLT